MEKIFCFAGGLLVGFAASLLFCYRIIHEGKKHILPMLELTYQRLAFLYNQICLYEKIGLIPKKEEKEGIKIVLNQMENSIRELKK